MRIRQDRPINDAPGGTLRLDDAVLEHMKQHAAEDYPHECCGLLVGTWGPDGPEVRWAERARNLNTERAHDRYELDPLDFMRVDEKAQEEGLEVVGFYHSHPDSPAEPSYTDAERGWPVYSYVIIGVREGKPTEIRSWVLHEESRTFSEQRVVNKGSKGQ